MRHGDIRRRVLLAVVALALLAVPAARPQPPRPGAPRLEPVAETRLLMEGLNLPNFQALDQGLRQRPADAEGWVFLRGQALLIAETGNLLLLRPPRQAGQETWMQLAMDLRAVATGLARLAANRDFERSRAAFVDLAQTCNRCHQTFRVPAQIVPFRERRPPAAPAP